MNHHPSQSPSLTTLRIAIKNDSLRNHPTLTPRRQHAGNLEKKLALTIAGTISITLFILAFIISGAEHPYQQIVALPLMLTALLPPKAYELTYGDLPE